MLKTKTAEVSLGDESRTPCKSKKLEEIQGGRMVKSICPPGLDSKGEGAEEGGMARNEEQGSSRRGEDVGRRRVGGARFLTFKGEGVRTISCICLNARSIMNKMNEFMFYMLEDTVWP